MTDDLDKTLLDLQKKYGKGVVVRGDTVPDSVDVIPTGAILFDQATGIGGIPRGRLTEIFGQPSAGKTSLLLALMGSVHRRGEEAALIDVEHTFDPAWAEKFGVEPDRLYLSQPSSAEEALNVMEALIRSGHFTLVALDSIAALAPQKELEGDMDDTTVGLRARLMGKSLVKMNAAVHQTNTAAVLVNQLREKIGVMHGSPKTTPGGKAMAYYASMRIELYQAEQIKQGQNPIGARIAAKFVKNKCARPFTSSTFDVLFDEGISHTAAAIDAGLESGTIKKAGAWLRWGEKQFQGREGFRRHLIDHPEDLAVLTAEVLSHLSGAAVPEEEEE